MRHALALLLLAASTASATEYRFDEVSRKVILNHDTPVAIGQRAKGGDKVETGWFSRALIASDVHRAKFEIFSATEVTLAEEEPGVILTLERGRIRAAFDKIIGTEPRVVKTPGALLAVRGTQFDVHVDTRGNTTLDVFEGVVEVMSPLRNESIFVRPGEESTFSREHPPHVQPMPQDRRRPEGDAGSRPTDHRKPEDGGTRPPDGDHHGGHQPAPPSQAPPPRKPPE